VTSQQPPKRDPEYFDHWYAGVLGSSARNAIVARTLGLPPGMLSTGSLTWSGLAEVTEALRLPRDGLLVDAACGFGGYGIEVAQRSGARLLGFDFSSVALAEARVRSAELRPACKAEFLAQTLGSSGLPAGVVDGLMCLDSVQFADPPLGALLEFRRVLAPGARLVLTGWEAVAASDERVPMRIRAMDLERDLPAAGFTDVRVQDKPAWREAELRMWQEAVAAPADDDDPGLASMQAEGRRSLEIWDAMRRVFATATAPRAFRPNPGSRGRRSWPGCPGWRAARSPG
jgi:SAM-dependent methyltransferase